MKQNLGIRAEAKAARVPLWAIAMELGVSEPTLMRWIRLPLSRELEERFRAAIARVPEERRYPK